MQKTVGLWSYFVLFRRGLQKDLYGLFQRKQQSSVVCRTDPFIVGKGMTRVNWLGSP